MKIEDQEFNDVIKTLRLLRDASAYVFLFRVQSSDYSPEFYTMGLLQCIGSPAKLVLLRYLHKPGSKKA